MTTSNKLVLKATSILLAVAWWLPLPAYCASGETAADLGAKASAFASLSRHSDAIAAWQQVFSRYPGHYYDCAPAMLGLGKAYAAMGDNKNAAWHFTNLLAAYSVGFRQESAQALLGLGGIADSEEKRDQALSYYARLLNEYPDMSWQCAEARLRMAACYQALGRRDREMEALNSLLNDYPREHDRCAEALMRIAQSYIAKGKTKDAESQLLRIVTDYPQLVLWRAEALLQVGAIRSKAGRTDSALGAYGRLLSECKYALPQRMKALMARAAICETSGKRGKALSDYVALIQGCSGYTRQADVAKARASKLLVLVGIPASAVQSARQSLSHYEQIRSKVALSNETQELAEMSGVGSKYARLRTERMQSTMQTGRACRYLGQYPQALEQFRKVLTEYGDTEEWRVQATLEIGDTQREAGSPEDALATYAGIIETSPSITSACALAALGRGQAYEQLKQQGAAIIEYAVVRKNYATMREQSGSAVQATVQILLAQKRYGAAITEADSFATECASDSRWRLNALVWKGAAQMAARRYNDTAITLQELIAKYPDQRDASREASNVLVQALILANRPNEAMPILEEMLRDNYWTPARRAWIAGWIGMCYMRQGRDDTEDYLTKVIGTYTGTEAADDALFNRAVLRCERQALDEALADIDVIRSAHLRHYALGEYYAAQGRLDEAAAEYEQVLPSLPADYRDTYEQPYQALVRLESIYRALGNENSALASAAKKQEIYKEHIAPGA